jgi:hypothetical protein
MKPIDPPRRHLLAVAACAALAAPLASALPGAHGPNGEHLDVGGAGAGPANAVPRLESHSDTFELVATLAGDELSILVDRYDTNEPVLGATVEVESGPLKAVAKFHTDHGDYAVDSKPLLEQLSRPGEHPLVITIVAGDQSDLLEGMLKVTPEQLGHGHDHDQDHDHLFTPVRAAMAGAAVLLLGGSAAWVVRRRRAARRQV